MKKIIYTRSDGGVSIVSPAININEPVGFDEEQAIVRALARLPTDAMNPQVVDGSIIPTDRTFRNALVQIGASVVHDMPKCREIHRARLRELRRPLFTENDLAIRDAQIDGDSVTLVAAIARRNALRDVTADARIDAAQTPEALKTVMPEVLK